MYNIKNKWQVDSPPSSQFNACSIMMHYIILNPMGTMLPKSDPSKSSFYFPPRRILQSSSHLSLKAWHLGETFILKCWRVNPIYKFELFESDRLTSGSLSPILLSQTKCCEVNHGSSHTIPTYPNYVWTKGAAGREKKLLPAHWIPQEKHVFDHAKVCWGTESPKNNSWVSERMSLSCNIWYH